MEAKPILIVKVDNSREIFPPLFEIQDIISNDIKDYNVIVVPFINEIEPIQFQTFFSKYIKDIDFEELKELIKTL